MAEQTRATVIAFAINTQVAKSFFDRLQSLREDDDPSVKKLNEMVDKHMASTLAQLVTKFGK